MLAVPSTTESAPAPATARRDAIAPARRDAIATAAAIAAFRRLQTKVAAIMLAHERPDGGLICERVRPGAPPLFYRVTAGGRVQADRRYDLVAPGFAPVPLPAGID